MYVYIYTHTNRLCITEYYKNTINLCTYKRAHWKPLLQLCSWSGYRPGCKNIKNIKSNK